jgi:hypothetical protein
MNIPSLQIIKDAYQKAPEYVRVFIKSGDLTRTFNTLRATHKLHLDEAGTFADILNSMILELIPLGTFETMITENLPRLTAGERAGLTREVNEKIFAVLRQRATAPAPVPEPQTPSTSSGRAEPVPSAAIQIAQMPKVPAQSVVTEKLSVPMSETPKDVTVSMPPTTNPRYSGGSDPYREPVE